MIYALIFCLGLLQGIILATVGSWLARRRRRPTLPICGCQHHLSFHSGGGACGFKPGHYDRTCGCAKYIQRDTTANAALYAGDL